MDHSDSNCIDSVSHRSLTTGDLVLLTVALKYLAVIRSHRWVTAMGTMLMVECGDAE